MFTMMETGLRLGPVRIFAEISNDHFSKQNHVTYFINFYWVQNEAKNYNKIF
jgi:hypothetical protein